MRLLITTQVVDKNDPILGFFHDWIREFALHFERLTVICLKQGACELPANVKVISLGKERREARIKNHESRMNTIFLILNSLFLTPFKLYKRVIYVFKFYKIIIVNRKNYDAVFVHMNPEYVMLGAPAWKITRKPVGLWYAHGTVNNYLSIAEKLADFIFTSTPEGCRIKSEKIKIVGQGINLEKFTFSDPEHSGQFQKQKGKFTIVSVGRISPVKDYETLIRAIEIISKKYNNIRVVIAGGAGLPEQEKYLQGLKDMARDNGLEGVISFLGPVPFSKVPELYASADLYVNMSRTGSLDKTILEAMASGIPIITCNDAGRRLLQSFPATICEAGDAVMLSERISAMIEATADKREDLIKNLRMLVEKEHSLPALSIRIAGHYEATARE